MCNFFWLHVKKAGGTSMRKALGDRYVTMNREEPTPFVALDRSKGNNAVNNYRLPTGPYDHYRMPFVRIFLNVEEEFREMFKLGF